MIYGPRGGQVKLIRIATPEDAALEKRKPYEIEYARCEIGYLMVGRFVRPDGSESEDRLFDLAVLRAGGGTREIIESARAAGNTII